jgi:leucyl aminopeptidase
MKYLVAVLALAVSSSAFILPSEIEGKRLIQFGENELPKSLSQAEVDKLVIEDIGFMDITDHQTVPQAGAKIPSTLAIPTALRFQSVVTPALSRISIPRMTEFLTTFIAFNNRYYTAASGSESSNFLLSEIQRTIASSGYQGVATVSQYTHSWAQKSVIARIQGTNGNPKQIIVLGAHQDSTSSGMPTGRAPGADDDGSGSTTILEAFRVLLESGFIPKTTIEFQWYAAEEVGLRGSQDIANAYKADGVDVVAMTQFDMTGYLSANKRIGFVTDFTDAELNAFLRKVVDGYCTYTWMNKTCGYACSDHASYYRAGYKAAFPFEDSANPNIHTTRDTLTYVNFSHMQEYAKLAVGFAIEVAEPSTL